MDKSAKCIITMEFYFRCVLLQMIFFGSKKVELSDATANLDNDNASFF